MLIKRQSFSDKTAIALSLLCTIHCLALPLLLIMFPSVASLQLDNEAFHYWILLAVLPTSIYALTLGCKQHQRIHLLAVGSTGLACLLLAVSLPEPLLGTAGEKVFTLIGATLIAYGHVRNYRLCQHKENCTCAEHEVAK